MAIEGMKIAVAGGSIAGCATAIALSRAGCDVTVFERSSSLQDRGSGIAIPVPLRDQLIEAGYIDAGYATCRLHYRRWVVREGDLDIGRRLWGQESEGEANNWGNLWRSLRSKVPDDVYKVGSAITAYAPALDGVQVTFDGGAQGHFDAVVGADGYRSKVRELIHPHSEPQFAGYVLWRGNYEESRVTDRSWLDETAEDGSWYTVCYPGGHGVFYMIPGFDDRSDIGHRRVNWAVYAPTPPGRDFSHPSSLAPGAVDEDLYAVFDALVDEHFPPYHQQLIRHSAPEEVSLQPIYDEPVPSYVQDRLLLIGDAGTVTRPHTGSGATKALQDALSLERLAAQADNWESMAAAYNEERVASGNSLVELGRRIGYAQVESTPDWKSMKPADFVAWTKATLAGDDLYFYGKSDESA
ncbi:MAG: FAD-dependent monooxygenase [Acidimicrobiia bacterium]